MHIQAGRVALEVRLDGSTSGPALVLINSLGTDLRLWDKIIPFLPSGLRIIRFDKRGHGGSEVPPPPYSMDDLVDDAAALLEQLQVKDCVVAGCSIGGVIAQGLAARRSDLVRAIVLSNTAAKIGSPEFWEERISNLQSGGLEQLADDLMLRWFSAEFRERPELVYWRQMLVETSIDGYVGCCAAVANSDMSQSTAELPVPALVIGGSEDGSTPPALVEATSKMLRTSRYVLIENVGHLPCVEKPKTFARIVAEFLEEIDHV